jgi:hypothetical protein
MCENPLNNCGCSQSCSCSSLSCLQVKTFNAVTSVNISTNIITITNHDFLTGQKVLYTAVGGAAPAGLVTNTDYYIIKITDNTFKLATTLANSLNAIAIDITAVGVGTSHILTASNFTTPVPCLEGCLTDTRTDCTFLSEDLDICTNILPKGTTVTQALEDLAAAVCNGVVVTTQDVKVKIDANDTTNGFLFDKITVCDNITKTITNVNNNETLRLCTKLDTVTGSGNNILVSGVNGLYVPPPTFSGYNLTSLFSNSVNLTLSSVVGGQTILADLKKDTTTGSNNNILQISSTGVYVPPNTPITVSLPTSSGLNLTATGTNNHTLTASIKLDTTTTPSNALSLTSAGLYCPPATSGSSITIQSTPTILSQLTGSTYNLTVQRSLDACNGLVLGSDNKLYVNNVEEPNSLGFVVSGFDIYFEFQGPTTTNTLYEVEVQGTTGSPLSWITATFDSLTGPVLRYDVGSTSTPNTIRARVRYRCGNNYSNWVGKTYDPPFTLVSDNGTINVSASSSGVNNQYSVDIVSQNCTNNFNASVITRSIVKIGSSFFVRIERNVSVTNSDVYRIDIESPSLSTILGGITVSDEAVILIPMEYYVAGESYQINVIRHCTFRTAASSVSTLAITVFPSTSSCSTNGLYLDPTNVLSYPGFNINGGNFITVARTTGTNPYKLKYMISSDGILEFAGVLRLTGTIVTNPGGDTGWLTLLDISNFASCTTPSNNIYKIDITGPATTEMYEYQTDAPILSKSYLHFLRRSGNTIQIRFANMDAATFINPFNLNTFVNLSGLKF